jgi:cytochrome c oxidase cbb3-type subunit I/II
VPYARGYEKLANADMEKQAQEITASLQKDKLPIQPDREIVALIAYLQRLGKDIKSTH